MIIIYEVPTRAYLRSPIKIQPRSQSSSAISDVTSPVKLVGKIRLGRAQFQASCGHSDSANRPGYEADQNRIMNSILRSLITE